MKGFYFIIFMDMLYVHIQSGKYEIPKWLSRDSIQILDDLLQVDPKRRIPIRELMRHPWLKKGGEHSVTCKSKYCVSGETRGWAEIGRPYILLEKA